MKKNLKTAICILLMMVIFQRSFVFAQPQSNRIEKKEMRGIWVATVLNIDYPSKPTTDSSILKKEAIDILDHVKNMGLNAVFLQVRPSGDALYPSKYFPWSKYLTGKQGLMPNDDFDPLKFWVDEAHKRGIALHAWVNPYRITKKTMNEVKHDFASLDSNHPALYNPNWVVMHSDGNLYFDPGIPEVRKLVIDGVLEIIENYDVDGIHFDDYFYPGQDFNDKDSYEKYGSGFINIDDWRRENVNLLIGDVSRAIKDASKNIRFGISPFGIWANKATNPLGSDTKGMQSYYKQYADTRKWVKEGMIDYIAPQIYWHIGFAVADYSKILNWWMETTEGTNVDLYIGQAAYKAGNESLDSPWYGFSEMERQLELNSKFMQVKGSIFFSYNSLARKPVLSGLIKTIYDKEEYARANIPMGIYTIKE
ncbi:glycoside hydrolase family 10 protein [Marinisporobacter balticus]|uniref:Uncharacterized lipoprotein YddW (UPF0748 family) n=1 Tax=Marinisporobacter balticus TaxID=2018667 RepID=A0A4R2KUE7_9FIRM|nr:family 10 glycosylhydrolase [Marinisporobacter balticus]TCO78041.1 uncharacterized lipoprotein YddW (UPF0748 family) [Marinisporobacter balticus]